MASTDENDRSHPATSRRRADARLRGQVPRSGDLSAALMLGGSALLLGWLGPKLVTSCGHWLSQSFSSAPAVRGDQLAMLGAGPSMSKLLMSAAGLLLSLWLVSIIVRLVQIGPLFTPQAPLPQAARVSPAAGLRRLFSAESTLRGIFWLLKLIAVVALIGWTLKHESGRLAATMHPAPGQMAVAIGEFITSFGLRLCGVLCVLAALDYGWQWWLHEQQLRMTSDELREERRESSRRPNSFRNRRSEVAHAPQTDQVRTV